MSTPAKALYTETYKAPEFEGGLGPIRRRTDIWGLGCTFLELITWYLRGWKAVSIEFPDIRDVMTGNLTEDAFFTIVNGTPVVKEGVVKWISQLREEKGGCTTFFRKFLDFIEQHMLLVTPSDRASASEVSLKMREFYMMLIGTPVLEHSE